MRIHFPILMLMLTTIVTPGEATASQCSLAEYDQALPDHVNDRTPATGTTEFEWSSDVDPDGGGSRSWHFIKNLHDRDLSLDWKKPDLIISFDRPLPKDGVACKRDYGDAEAFVLDQDAPIYVTGEGDKPARAYVNPKRPSTRTGAAIETNYRNEDGGVSYGLVELIIRYLANEGVSEVTIRTEPSDVKLAFIPDRLGVDEKSLNAELIRVDAVTTEMLPLSKLAKFDESIQGALGADIIDERFVLVSRSFGKPVFLKQFGSPRGATPLLLISPSGSVVAATFINLDQLSDQEKP